MTKYWQENEVPLLHREAYKEFVRFCCLRAESRHRLVQPHESGAL